MANPLVIYPIPVFTDNYIWCIHDGCHAIVVDPGDAKPVMAFLNKHELRLDGILITHHHADHTGGIAELTALAEGIPVYGPNNPKIPQITNPLTEGDTVTFDRFGLTFEVMEVPGHTLDHIAYYNCEWLFCGDTLFSGGCGRLFEGTPEQMLVSLRKFLSLPEHTQVFCTHEYTLANLAFAKAVEPENQTIIDTFTKVSQLREVGLPSLPTNLAIEKQINPFLRADNSANWGFIARQTGELVESDVAAFAATRRWKDNF